MSWWERVHQWFVTVLPFLGRFLMVSQNTQLGGSFEMPACIPLVRALRRLDECSSGGSLTTTTSHRRDGKQSLVPIYALTAFATHMYSIPLVPVQRYREYTSYRWGKLVIVLRLIPREPETRTHHPNDTMKLRLGAWLDEDGEEVLLYILRRNSGEYTSLVSWSVTHHIISTRMRVSVGYLFR